MPAKHQAREVAEQESGPESVSTGPAAMWFRPAHECTGSRTQQHRVQAPFPYGAWTAMAPGRDRRSTVGAPQQRSNAAETKQELLCCKYKQAAGPRAEPGGADEQLTAQVADGDGADLLLVQALDGPRLAAAADVPEAQRAVEVPRRDQVAVQRHRQRVAAAGAPAGAPTAGSATDTGVDHQMGVSAMPWLASSRKLPGGDMSQRNSAQQGFQIVKAVALECVNVSCILCTGALCYTGQGR